MTHEQRDAVKIAATIGVFIMVAIWALALATCSVGIAVENLPNRLHCP